MRVTRTAYSRAGHVYAAEMMLVTMWAEETEPHRSPASSIRQTSNNARGIHNMHKYAPAGGGGAQRGVARRVCATAVHGQQWLQRALCADREQLRACSGSASAPARCYHASVCVGAPWSEQWAAEIAQM